MGRRRFPIGMKVFIQKHQGEFPNINLMTAFLGFQEKGYEIITFEYPERETLPLDDRTIVCGGIPVVLAALQRLGVTPPELPSIPPQIAAFAERAVGTSTLGAVRAQVNAGQSIFIKPLPQDRKLFPGKVLREFRDLISTTHLPDAQIVVASAVVEFRSEYRVFVLDGEILGIRHYKGDMRRFPDFAVIDRAIAAYSNAPAAYAIDFGIVEDGRTLLVETNEAYALGCYGLQELRYSSLIERRWQELLASR
jgi:ATP-grasp domain, R2K clade family 2